MPKKPLPAEPYFNEHTLKSTLYGLKANTNPITEQTSVIEAFGAFLGQSKTIVNNTTIINEVVADVFALKNTKLTIDGVTQDLSADRTWVTNSGLTPLGNWDASLNNPTLVSSVGTTGDIYKVSVAGTTLLNGNSTWDVGDDVLFANGVWNRVVGGLVGNPLVVNVTTIVAGTDKNILYDNAGILGELVPGNLTETVSSVLQITSGSGALLKSSTIQVQKADATHDGYVTDTNFNNWEGKLTSPLTTKADLLTWAGGNNIRLAVGPDDYLLVPDFTLARGVKWINPTPRRQIITTSGAITATFNADANDELIINQLTGTLTLANPSGTPFRRQRGRVLIKACASVQTIGYGGKWAEIGTTLLVNTVPDFDTDIYFIYNVQDDTYQIVGVFFTPNQYKPAMQVWSSGTVITADFQTDDGVDADGVGNTILANWTGTPRLNATKVFSLRDAGSFATISYGGLWRPAPSSGLTLPTVTIINKWLLLFASWNDLDGKVDVWGINQEL